MFIMLLLLLLIMLLLQAHRGWPGKVRCVSLSISASTSGAGVCRAAGSDEVGRARAAAGGWQRRRRQRDAASVLACPAHRCGLLRTSNSRS
jgi:hypothetical protein